MKVPFRKGSAMNVRAHLIGVALFLLCLPVISAQGNFDQSYRHALRQLDSLILFEFWDEVFPFAFELEAKYRETRQWPALVRCLSYKARAHIDTGGYAGALPILQEAEELASEHLEEDHPEWAVLWQQWAVFYGELANKDEELDAKMDAEHDQASMAVSYFDRAVELLEECCEDSPLLGVLYMDYGANLGETAEAIEKYEMADQILTARTAVGKVRKVDIYIDLAWLERFVGELTRYREYLKAAFAIIEEDYDLQHPVFETALYQLAADYFDKQEFAEAVELYKVLIELEKAYANPSKRVLISYYAMTGSAFTNMGNDEAMEYLKVALQILANLEQADYLLGYVYRFFGQEFRRQEQFDSAQYYLEKSVQSLLADKDEGLEVSATYYAMASMDRELGKYNEALADIENSLEYLDFAATEVFQPSLLDGQDIENFIEPLILKGQIYVDLYRHSGEQDYLYEALETFQINEQISEYVRSGRYTEETNVLVSDHFYRSAAEALKVIHELYQISGNNTYISEAFELMEHNRYAQLSQELYRKEFARGKSIPDSIVNRLNHYRASMDSLRAMDSDQYSALILQLGNEYEDLKDEVSSDYPGYFRIRYDEMYDLSQTQSVLDPGELVLEYFWFDTTLMVISMSAENSHFSVTNTSHIDQSFDRYLQWLHHSFVPDSLDFTFEEFARFSHYLFKILVEPYLNEDIQKLIISPDGDLTYLPFEMLLYDTSKVGFDQAEYLLRKLEIQYIHSANLMLRYRQHEPLYRPRLLAMAYSSEDDAQGMSSRAEFEEIPHSGLEVQEINDQFGKGRVDILKGTEATESAFKQRTPHYDIVHLALHGVGGDSAIAESRLVLKSVSDDQDGNLFAYELYPLDLSKLRLAVLSACETGVGKSLRGEGVFSIARGFAFAGTPSMVMSLWEVDDRSTASIMQQFYAGLNDGMTVGKAIQSAKIAFLDDPDVRDFRPFYWAAFVPMGDTSLAIEGRTGMFILLIAIILGLAFLVLIWLRMKK